MVFHWTTANCTVPAAAIVHTCCTVAEGTMRDEWCTFWPAELRDIEAWTNCIVSFAVANATFAAELAGKSNEQTGTCLPGPGAWDSNTAFSVTFFLSFVGGPIVLVALAFIGFNILYHLPELLRRFKNDGRDWREIVADGVDIATKTRTAITTRLRALPDFIANVRSRRDGYDTVPDEEALKVLSSGRENP